MAITDESRTRHLRVHRYQREDGGEHFDEFDVPIDDRAHLDDEVRKHGQVREWFDADLVPLVGQFTDACELLASVDTQSAGAAGGMQARMSQGERGIAVQLDPAQRIEPNLDVR